MATVEGDETLKYIIKKTDMSMNWMGVSITSNRDSTNFYTHQTSTLRSMRAYIRLVTKHLIYIKKT